MLDVFEITIRVYTLEDIVQTEAGNVIADFIDSYLLLDSKFAEFHEQNKYKLYCFDSLTPLAENGRYRKDALYRFRFRSVDKKLVDYLMSGIANHSTAVLKGLQRTIRVIPRRPIEAVYTITPIVIKNPDGKGYWRDCMNFGEFENAVKQNLAHKYEVATGERVEKDAVLYEQIELLSKCAIGIPYKGITLLGDKISIQVSGDEAAQRIWYFALGVGIGTMNSRGAGFLQYRLL